MMGFRDLLSKASGLISISVEQVKAPVNEKDAADAPGRSLVARYWMMTHLLRREDFFSRLTRTVSWPCPSLVFR